MKLHCSILEEVCTKCIKGGETVLWQTYHVMENRGRLFLAERKKIAGLVEDGMSSAKIMNLRLGKYSSLILYMGTASKLLLYLNFITFDISTM